MTRGATQQRPPRMRLSEQQGMRLKGFRATYDAAVTTSENAAHWSAADSLSANASINPFVRAIVRQRARYEFQNNTYCSGMLHTYAQDVVGEGPGLEILLPDEDHNAAIERRFEQHMRAIRLAPKLRTAILTRKRDGAVFLQRFTNYGLDHPIPLDLLLIEDDQVATPGFGISPDQITDGIVYDDFGNPVQYHVLKRHPGEIYGFPRAGETTFDKEDVRAEHMRHLFTVERPGQRRGVSEIAAALALYAQLRRFTLAVIAAAETAADMAGIIKSNLPPDPDDPDVQRLDPMDQVEIIRRSLVTLPDGHEMQQLRAEQPATTYEMFKREIVAEIARVLNMPYLVACGNAGSSNFASAQVDLQGYDRTLQIERDDLEGDVLDWHFDAWYAEAIRIPGYLPDGCPREARDVPRGWLWIGREHADPNREAAGEERKLANLTTSLAERYARRGLRWRGQLQQIAKERAFAASLGLTSAATAPPPDPDALDEKDEREAREAKAQ